jgi:hypothetical protein
MTVQDRAGLGDKDEARGGRIAVAMKPTSNEVIGVEDKRGWIGISGLRY